jgi:CubicO group peptidase (beta-lactamase class C family)
MTPPRPAPAVDLHALVAALHTHVPDVLRATRTPGLTLALADRAGHVHALAFGLADVADGTPMRPDAVMPGGSLTKLPLAFATLQLVDAGHLDLHRPVAQTAGLPEAVNPFGRRPLTPYELLTHTSGLSTDTYDATLTPPVPLADHLRAGYAAGSGCQYGGVGARWAGPPGAYRYSNFGAATVGHAVERTNPDELQFGDYVDRNVLAPLGLASTCVPRSFRPEDAPADLLDRRPTGYARLGPWAVPTPTLHSALSPSVGVLTTARDYACLLAAIFLPGHPDHGKVLPPAAVRAMVTPQTSGTYEGVAHHVGLGVWMGDLDGPDAWLGASGQYPYGWYGLARVYPHHGLAVAALANAWDLPRWMNPVRRTAPGLVADFCLHLLRADHPRPAERMPWRDGAAYAAGLFLAERVSALLGAGRLDPSALDRLASRVRFLDDPADATGWNAEAFVAGASALPAASHPDVIREALRALPVDGPTLGLHALAWGASSPDYPVPIPFWADRRGEDLHLPHLDLYR